MISSFIIENKNHLIVEFKKWMNKASSQSVYCSAIFGGGDVKELETLFCKTFKSSYAVALSSCTAALHTSLICSGFNKRGKVLVFGSNWPGIDGVVKFVGGKPIRLDNKLELTDEMIGKLVNNNLSIIIVARTTDDEQLLKKLKTICEKYSLILIEDFADLKNIKIKNAVAPEFGQFATFSFGYDKWLQAGEGGMLLCNNFESYRRAVQFTQHPIYQKARLSAKQNNPEYYGLNYRIHPLAASIALYQLQEKVNDSNCIKVK